MVLELDRVGRDDGIPAVVDQMSTDVYKTHIADWLERKDRPA